MVMFVIEHLEPVVSRWVWIEYKHASKIVGKENLLITNVKDPLERKLLSKIAYVTKHSIIEVGCPAERIIILDPQAREPLEPEDFSSNIDFIVIGGIMGDYPPKGRTWKLLTSRLPSCKARNLGKKQLSVDGAVYVAYMISKGKRLNQIPIKDGFEIKVSENFSIILPYAYPIVNNKPLISQELIDYLIHDIEKEEIEAIRRGRVETYAKKFSKED